MLKRAAAELRGAARWGKGGALQARPVQQHGRHGVAQPGAAAAGLWRRTVAPADPCVAALLILPTLLLSSPRPQATEALRITPDDLLKFGVVRGRWLRPLLPPLLLWVQIVPALGVG